MNNQEEIITNQGQLIGEIIKAPVKTHEVQSESFYELFIKVKRLSDTVDILPVCFGERLAQNLDKMQVGAEVAFTGEYRSMNKLSQDNRSKLILYFFAKEMYAPQQAPIKTNDLNYLKLRGYICKLPILRETPFHKKICDCLVAVNRMNNSRSDYIPCISWGTSANFMGGLNVGTKIELEGRIQSREYKKSLPTGEQETHTAYEVSCKNFKVLDNAASIHPQMHATDSQDEIV